MPASLSPSNLYLHAIYPSLIKSKTTMRVQTLLFFFFLNQKQNGENYLNDSGFLLSL